ncbi:hypothetical protein D3C71_2134410 [compost metagenome]
MDRPAVGHQWRQLDGRYGEDQYVIVAATQGGALRARLAEEGHQCFGQRQAIPFDQHPDFRSQGNVSAIGEQTVGDIHG